MRRAECDRPCLNLRLHSLFGFTRPREAELSCEFTQGFVRSAGDDGAEQGEQEVEFRVHFFFTWPGHFIGPLLSVQEAFQWLNMRNLA